jgi:hypothetical protein
LVEPDVALLLVFIVAGITIDIEQDIHLGMNLKRDVIGFFRS